MLVGKVDGCGDQKGVDVGCSTGTKRFGCC